MIDPHQGIEKLKNKFSMRVQIKGRKTGILRSANLFFVFLDGKIFARTSYDKNWLKNAVANADATITISGFLFRTTSKDLKDLGETETLKLRKAFRQKYRFMDYFVLWFLIRGKERFVEFTLIVTAKTP